jgi:hypothetical protein
MAGRSVSLGRRAWRKNGTGWGPSTQAGCRKRSVSARIAAEQTALSPGCPDTGKYRIDHPVLIMGRY